MSKLQELIKKLCPDGVEFRKLGEVCEITIGEFVHKNKQTENGIYPVYNGGKDNTGFYEEYNNVGNKVIISARGANAGYINKVLTNYWAGNSCYSLSPFNRQQLNWIFLYYTLKNKEKELMNNQQTGSIPALSKKQIEAIEILLPPLEVQNEIVRILDAFTAHTAELQAELQARKEQYEYYRNKLLTFDENDERVKWMKLGNICDNYDRKRKAVTASNRVSGPYPYYGASGIVDYVNSFIFDGDFLLISEDGANLLARNTPIAFSIKGKNWVNNHAHILKFQDMCTQKYVEYYINMIDVSQYVSGGAQPKLNQENLNKIPIPIPPLSEQQRIVSILDKFESLVNDLSEGLPAEIAAVQEQYEYYRNKLLTFKRKS